MKIYVCIKQVPDLDAPVQIKDGELIQESERLVLNAYDASAVEEALVLKEEHGGEVEVVLAGPGGAKETIRKALAMGADKATHIQVEAPENYDSASFASILAAFFKDKEYDFIATGKQSQDTDAGLAGAMLAEKLDLPYAANAVGIDGEEDGLVITRQGDTGQEIIKLPFTSLVTCSNDMNEPRIPSLKGIMKSKKKPVDAVSLDDLGISEADIEAKTKTTGYEEKPEREAGPKEEGEPEELAQKLVAFLDEKTGML